MVESMDGVVIVFLIKIKRESSWSKCVYGVIDYIEEIWVDI